MFKECRSVLSASLELKFEQSSWKETFRQADAKFTACVNDNVLKSPHKEIRLTMFPEELYPINHLKLL